MDIFFFFSFFLYVLKWKILFSFIFIFLSSIGIHQSDYDFTLLRLSAKHLVPSLLVFISLISQYFMQKLPWISRNPYRSTLFPIFSLFFFLKSAVVSEMALSGSLICAMR